MCTQGLLSWELCGRSDGWSAGFFLVDTHVSISVGFSFHREGSSSSLAGNATVFAEGLELRGSGGLFVSCANLC